MRDIKVLCKTLEDLTKRQWTFGIVIRPEGYRAVACHDAWVTSNSYRARVLPSAEADSLEEVIEKILDLVLQENIKASVPKGKGVQRSTPWLGGGKDDR